jgi:cytoskeletal protein RodZ
MTIVIIVFLRRNSPAARTSFPTTRSVSPLLVSLIGALVWIVFVFAGINRWTSSSQHLTLAALPGITTSEIAACEAAGLHYPYALVAVVKQQGLVRVATELHLSSPRVQELVDASQLSEFRGIGVRNLQLLQAAGITGIKELAAQESAVFTAKLHQLGDEQALRPPYERQVHGWINAAQRWIARHP